MTDDLDPLLDRLRTPSPPRGLWPEAPALPEPEASIARLSAPPVPALRAPDPRRWPALAVATGVLLLAAATLWTLRPPAPKAHIEALQTDDTQTDAPQSDEVPP
jgi:hypothetical protein